MSKKHFATALTLIVVGLYAVIFSSLPGVLRLLLILLSLILVPYYWLKLRGEKAGDPEGRYPDPSKRPLPSMDSDDPSERGFARPEAPAYGPVRSGISYVQYLSMKYAWAHPDMMFFRRKFLKKKEKVKR